ncbi:MAG: hypothetical protein OXF93_12065 [Acidobacteria bacterium]|nr:hypothetical protein [Acidobacteriota bacterium]
MTRQGGRDSGAVAVACALAWALPGAGHLWLGRVRKGATFLVVLPLMFCVGVWLEGSVYPLDPTQPVVTLLALADLGAGGLYVLARLAGFGEGAVAAVTHEYGNTFILTAGLLNVLVTLDAFDTARGEKP